MNNLDKLWSVIDTDVDAIDFAKIDDIYYCDSCECKLSTNFYNSNSILNLQLCEKCYKNKPLYKLFNISEIDKTMHNPKDKPLIWPCIACDKKMGGGCKWKILKLDKQDRIYDMCLDCYNKDPNLSELTKNEFYKIDDNYVVCEHDDPILVNIAKIPNRKIPDRIMEHVTIDRAKVYTGLLKNLVDIPPDFGSLKEWTMFTDLYELPIVKTKAALLINCNVNNKHHKIASFVVDNNKNAAINIIFDSIDDYSKAYKDWKNNKIMNDLEYNKLLKKIKNDLQRNIRCEDKEFAKICKEFSGFIRIQKYLPIFYG